jgi:hypothetical protein
MLIWRVLRVGEQRFRRLDAPELLADVYEGRRFADGMPITRASFGRALRGGSAGAGRADTRHLAG